MVESMFSRLLKLSGSSLLRKPTEDFTTEILAGVLCSDQHLMDGFLNKVLKIEGEGFIVKTQKVYETAKVDMVFSNDDTLCFMENKVGAKEGKGQLKKYSKYLNKEAEKGGKVKYLRYCTKHYDPKYILEDSFCQVRWGDVYSYFCEEKDNVLAKDNVLSEYFVKYLEEEGMGKVSRIAESDIEMIPGVSGLFSKLDGYLDEIKYDFKECFGSPSNQSRSKGLSEEYPRYGLKKEDVLNGNNSIAWVAFGFEEDLKPCVYVECTCYAKHKEHELFKSAVEKNGTFRTAPTETEFVAWKQSELSNFTEGNQGENVDEWIRGAIGEWKALIESTPGLEFNK